MKKTTRKAPADVEKKKKIGKCFSNWPTTFLNDERFIDNDEEMCCRHTEKGNFSMLNHIAELRKWEICMKNMRSNEFYINSCAFPSHMFLFTNTLKIVENFSQLENFAHFVTVESDLEGKIVYKSHNIFFCIVHET